MDAAVVYWGNIGMMENKMETTIMGLHRQDVAILVNFGNETHTSQNINDRPTKPWPQTPNPKPLVRSLKRNSKLGYSPLTIPYKPATIWTECTRSLYDSCIVSCACHGSLKPEDAAELRFSRAGAVRGRAVDVVPDALQ